MESVRNDRGPHQDKVREQAQELEKARNELEKRLNANAILAKLEKAGDALRKDED